MYINSVQSVIHNTCGLRVRRALIYTHLFSYVFRLNGKCKQQTRIVLSLSKHELHTYTSLPFLSFRVAFAYDTMPARSQPHMHTNSHSQIHTYRYEYIQLQLNIALALSALSALFVASPSLFEAMR